MTDRPATWGPFAPGLSPSERIARLRALRVATGLIAGVRGKSVREHLRAAEFDPAHLPAAALAFDALPSRDSREIVSSFGKYGS